MKRALILFPSLCLMAFAALAGGPVNWSFEAVNATGGKIEVRLKATCDEGWHIYALSLAQEDGPIPTAIRMGASDSYLVGPVSEPAPEEAYDPNFGMDLRFHSEAVFLVTVERLKEGPLTILGEVEYMACNDKTCLPPKVLPFSLTVPVP
jgi:thiol:disulfide interchange protein DsbD